MRKSGFLEIARYRFDRMSKRLQEQNRGVEILEKKTEKAGETDGFQNISFAELPVPNTDITQLRFYFVTDALDVGESTGNGTGALAVYRPAASKYYRVADNTELAV